jgi:hypothetical protein
VVELQVLEERVDLAVVGVEGDRLTIVQQMELGELADWAQVVVVVDLPPQEVIQEEQVDLVVEVEDQEAVEPRPLYQVVEEVDALWEERYLSVLGVLCQLIARFQQEHLQQVYREHKVEAQRIGTGKPLEPAFLSMEIQH